MTRELGNLLLAAIMVAAGSAAAIAQPAVGIGRGHWNDTTAGAASAVTASPYGIMGGYWDTETYLGSLKTQLAITPLQERAWKDYTDTMTGVARQVALLDHIMFESMSVASWQERQALTKQMLQARQQALDTVHQAGVELVAALGLAQKDKAHVVLPCLGYRHRAPGLR